jgi:hypothetical protein
VTTANFPTSIQNLKTGITQARASKQNQGVNQLQLQFLSRLQNLQRSIKAILAMIQAVELTLSPPATWRSTLNFSSLTTIVNDFSTKVEAGTFDIVGEYDNISLKLDPIVQTLKNECNKVWITERNSILSAINLDFEPPNAQILKVIDPSVTLAASFVLLQRRLKLQKEEEFSSIWEDCDDDPSKFLAHVASFKSSIKQFKDAVDPVVTALSKTDPKVSQFLHDATRGEATMRQAELQEVKDWLAQDKKLLDSFLVRFSDEN